MKSATRFMISWFGMKTTKKKKYTPMDHLQKWIGIKWYYTVYVNR